MDLLYWFALQQPTDSKCRLTGKAYYANVCKSFAVDILLLIHHLARTPTTTILEMNELKGTFILFSTLNYVSLWTLICPLGSAYQSFINDTKNSPLFHEKWQYYRDWSKQNTGSLHVFHKVIFFHRQPKMQWKEPKVWPSIYLPKRCLNDW